MPAATLVEQAGSRVRAPCTLTTQRKQEAKGSSCPSWQRVGMVAIPFSRATSRMVCRLSAMTRLPSISSLTRSMAFLFSPAMMASKRQVL